MPDEILFSPTLRCNLSCRRCNIKQGGRTLSTGKALGFIRACHRSGIDKIGFTGGEPFLALGFLCAVSREAVRLGMTFTRLMTNGAWFSSKKDLTQRLSRLFRSGYDGEICVSVDAFHSQSIKKTAVFIETVSALRNRPDPVSIAWVKDTQWLKTKERLERLASLLGARLVGFPGARARIESGSFFIKIFPIALSLAGLGQDMISPWRGEWFKDDLCKGPGNVLFVLPDGSVKPCCGYGSDADILSIGSILRDSPLKLLRNAEKNIFTRTIFSKGLHPIRRALESGGISFPGRTADHCFFCYYLSSSVPRRSLRRALRTLCG